MSRIIKVTKISDCENPVHPDHIKVGSGYQGLFVSEPEVGKCFYVGNVFRSSSITKIIDENTFETKNSIYRWEYVK